MSATTDEPMPNSASDDERDRDAARISAEIVRVDGGTDPFAAAVRATRMPMVVSDPRLPDNPIVFANDAFCRLSGFSRQEIIGRNCRFLQGPDTGQAAVATIRRAIQEVRPVQVDLRNYRKDGTMFWNRLLMAPVRDAGGELAYFFASQVDVTIERERLIGLETDNAALMAEITDRMNAQQESEARLRFATDAGRLGIWDLDLTTGVLTASELFKRNFGFDVHAPMDWDQVERAVHPDDRERRRASLDASLAAGSDYNIEYRIIRPDGRIAWLEVRGQIVRAVDGRALRVAGISLDVTERRRAEAESEVREQSLRLATEAADIGTWDLDLMTDVLTWSDRTKAMFGISPSVPCSMADFYAGLHPDDRDATALAFASAVDPDRRSTYDVEYRTIGREDGNVRWVAAKGRGLFDPEGRCVRAIGTAIDITARQAAEARRVFGLTLWDRIRTLSRTQEIMDAVVQALGGHLGASRVGYVQMQPDDRHMAIVTCFASGVAPLSGTLLPEDFGWKAIARLRQGHTVVQDDVADDTANNLRSWAAIDTRAFVAVPLVRDGRLRAALFVNHREPHAWSAADVGLVEEVAARTWDALQRAQAEAELREANATLERRVADRTADRDRVWMLSSDIMMVSRFDGTITAINPAWTTVLGWTERDLSGRNLLELIHPDDAEATRGRIAALAEGQAIAHSKTRYRHANGSFRWISWAAVPGGDFINAVGRDITAELDAALVLARTEEALRQAQKMEAVGQLTGGIAHDFNNLLTGIMASLEMVNRRVAAGRTDGLERFTAAAVTSAQRAAALTQRLLAFARRQPLHARRVEANRLVSDMGDLLRRTLGPGIRLEMVFADALWPTLCDPNQLENALLNLAINARDAMPEGGRLTIETANACLDDDYAMTQGHEVRPGQYVALSVTDTGIGMAPDLIAKAFDPFFTTKPIGQGTGLGLSMLYGFVKQSNGHVRVASEVGRGTTMTLYLPRHRGRTDDEAAGAPQPAARTAPDHGGTVLVVEDEATIRMLIVETLGELGLVALEAVDGPAGLRVLQSDAHIDLLITDVGLPGLNGRQLADAARVARPELRVLFVTGYAHNAKLATGAELEAGMEMITKPFALDALAAKIRSMMERRGS